MKCLFSDKGAPYAGVTHEQKKQKQALGGNVWRQEGVNENKVCRLKLEKTKLRYGAKFK